MEISFATSVVGVVFKTSLLYPIFLYLLPPEKQSLKNILLKTRLEFRYTQEHL